MSQQLQLMLQQAIQAFQISNYDGADLMLRRILQADPKNLPALHILGLIKASQKKYQEAVDLLAKAEKIHPNDSSIQYNLAKALMDCGFDKESLPHHQKAVQLAPNNQDAWFNYGKACSNLAHHDEALKQFDKALSLKPDYGEALLNKANTLHMLKKYNEALICFDRVLGSSPENIEAWSGKGLTLHELERYGDAITHFDQALSISQNDLAARYYKSNTLYVLKHYEDSLINFNYALELYPEYAELWSNKGMVLKELKLFKEAINHFDTALTLKPDYAEAWSNRGIVLYELKQYEESISNYDQALGLKPNYAEAWSNKGISLCAIQAHEEAINHFNKAINLKPDYAEAWSNKGIVLYELKQYEESIATYDKALSLRPNYPEAWSNKGISLHELKKYDEAITNHEQALSLKPDVDWIYGDLRHLKMKICSWKNFHEDTKTICSKIEAHQKIIHPFSLLSLIDNPNLQKKCSEIYVEDKYPFNPALGNILKSPKKEKIRIGYFSADFRNHPVSLLTVELFELHDKDRFEVIAFSYGADDKSNMRLRLSKAFSQFIDVSLMADINIARLSRELSIDIAVDLSGHTAHSRMGIFAYRVAPLQLSYIGYLGTTGAQYFDYLIADKIIIPDSYENFYSEKILYLQSYQANDRKKVISEKSFTRHELGLPKNGFIYCCFNYSYKILPETFDCWMKILRASEESVLFLYAENSFVEENLKNYAEAAGVKSERLIFGKHMSLDEYLARYRVCDLFLDTYPYGAGTTASDALWAGLPVLTMAGQTFASRIAASLLNAIGLPELITSAQGDYEALAIELSKNPNKINALRQKLAENILSKPLFDTPLFTKNIEAAYSKIYERYQADLPVESISIT